MTFSREKEAEIVEQNMKRIYRAVDNFTIRCSKKVVRIPYEDFVQEATIAFLEYIRRCKSEEELEVFPWYDVTHAMSLLVLSYQPLSCPSTSRDFHSVIHSMPETVSYDLAPDTIASVDGMSRTWVEDKDAMMDLEIFLSTLPDYADRIVAMKLWGLNTRKIASQMGVDESTIGKKLKKYLLKYKDFISEEDCDE